MSPFRPRLLAVGFLSLSVAFATTAVAKVKADDLLLGNAPPPLTEAERRLTEVPFAPGAPAVILIEALQMQWYQMEFVRNTYLRRTKILTENGVTGHAHFERQMSAKHRVQEIEARTVLPDGTEVDAGDRIRRDRSDTGIEVVRIDFPEVVPGAILEVFIRFNSDVSGIDPWVIQRTLPVLESRFIMQPAEGLRHATLLSGLPPELNKSMPVGRGGERAYVWRFENIAAVPLEANRPPRDDVAQRMFVILKSYDSPSTYGEPRVHFGIASEWKPWNRRVHELWEDWLLKDRAEARKLARELVNDEMSSRDKVRALRDALRDRIRVEWTDAWPYRESADDVIAKGSANSAGLAGALTVMLRAVGIDADLAAIRRRSDGSIPFDFPVPALFNDTLVRLADGLYFSPTGFGPLGDESYEFVGILAFPFDGKTEQPVVIADFPADGNVTQRNVELHLDAQGNLRATSEHRFAGVAAATLRSRLRGLEEDALRAEIQRRLHRGVESARVSRVEVEPDLASSSDLVVRCSWEASGFASRSGERLSLVPHLFDRIPAEDWAAETRRLPIHLGGAYETVDTVVIHLPEGVSNVVLPEPLRFGVKDVGAYETTYRSEPGRIVVERQMRLERYSFPPEAYGVLRQWFGRLADSDRSPVVLTF